jgi:hypothetical protein
VLHPVSSSHLSQPDLERIAARATTVADRLRLPLEPEPDVAGVAAYRRARWCEAAAENDEEAFAVRLAWEARCDVDAVLGPVRWPASLPLPGWTATLAAISASVSTGPFDRSEPRPPSDGRALPFEDLGLRLLSAARGLLHERDPDAFGRFSPGATQSLERVLLARLADTWAPTLCLEQALFFGPAPGGGTEPVGAPSRERYLASLDHLCADGMRRFFLEYSFLARLLARLVDL